MKNTLNVDSGIIRSVICIKLIKHHRVTSSITDIVVFLF